MMNKQQDEQAKERTNTGANLFLDEHGQMTKALCNIAPIEFHSGYRYFQ